MRFIDEEFGDPLYRPAVGMMILNKENKILVGQRLDNKDPAWQMPQGGISPHEDADQAMLRELQEEIGTRHVEIIIKSKTWYQYDLPTELAGRLWNGKFKGQRQIWYALRFRGEDKEINIHTYHPEFRSWKWVERDELLELIIPFKRDLYSRVLKDLWTYVLKHT
ncbi:MAG: RNA pyrophosphohydrolase [Alphaproteobacteria bacterium]|jgi:putative (di)nucleoside polyphosphate hydrolase|nr:RNA pyrophosphohydrolase [Alphaproteobacteria bacterium]MBP7729407.1 RNA pyrophosphohydrolase [Alphaproteobacteria bacterium]MDP3444559.1 RNA pyrophosphohydrolase [Ignavibacteria bacterium]